MSTSPASNTDVLKRTEDRSAAPLRRLGVAALLGGLAWGAGTPDVRAQGELYKLTTTTGSKFGVEVCAAGDVDQDGFADFAIGSNGATRVYSGPTGTILRQLPAGQLANLGDTDGDGVDDLLVGASLHSGATGAVLWSTPSAPSSLDSAFAGDFDGDGKGDALKIESGAVVVRSGANGNVLASFTGPARRVRGGFDVDQDGTPDFLVARDFFGVAELVSGTGAILATVTKAAASGAHVPAIDFLGDVDSDSIPDYAVGESHYLGNLGRVRAFSGATGGVLWEAIGNGNLFGRNLARIEDLDGDGKPDLLANANVDLASSLQTSSVTALSGDTGGVLFKVFSTDVADGFGDAMVSPGDVNGDERPDLVVGESLGTWQEFNRGVGYVYSSRCWDEYVDFPGCPGTNGLQPNLDLTGCLTAAGKGVLQLTEVAGNAPGLLLIRAGGPSLVSCDSLSIVGPSILVPFTTYGAPAPGLGIFSAVIALPPGFAPTTAFGLTALVLDPGAPAGIAVSNGLRVQSP